MSIVPSTSSINPGDWVVNQIDSVLGSLHSHAKENYKRAMAMQTAHQPKQIQRGVVKQETPTPSNTGAPIPGYRIQSPLTPSTTGAPVPGTLKYKTAIHPITGAAVRPVPVKRRGAKPTAPGTKPRLK